MVDGKECVEIINELKKLSKEDIEKLVEKENDFFNIAKKILGISYPLLSSFFKDISTTNKKELIKFVLELKKNEKSLDKLSKEILKKEERIKFLEKKQSNIDELIQETISQQLKQYEEKIKQLEKENKELKEQLGYYE